MNVAQSLRLTPGEKAELTRRAYSYRGGKDMRRARVILLIARGASWQQAMRKLKCSRAFIARWLGRFREARVGGLRARHHGQHATVLTARLEAHIVELGRKQRDTRRARLTTRALAARLGVSHMTVHRVWRNHGIGC